MKLRGKEKNKFINIVLISILTFLLFACLITLVIDIANNKGILPVIFFILMIYSILLFFYFLFHTTNYYEYGKKKLNIKFSYLIFFLINLFLFILSVITLWL